MINKTCELCIIKRNFIHFFDEWWIQIELMNFKANEITTEIRAYDARQS